MFNPARDDEMIGRKPKMPPDRLAIAGGVVGGVVGLALVAGLAWWFLRRRKQKNAIATNHPEQPPTGADEKYKNVAQQAPYGQQVFEASGRWDAQVLLDAIKEALMIGIYARR